MEGTITQARDFVAALDLPEASNFAPARARSSVTFESGQPQALVVGSELVSFAPDTAPQLRADVVNALLLAQLRAKKVMPQPDSLGSLRRWYDEYFDVLSQIGFAIEQKTLQRYHGSADGFEAHEAVLAVAAPLLAGATGALAVLTSTLTALQKMDATDPWITVFNRESRAAHTAHFQVATAGTDPDGSCFVVLTAFAVEATSDITQVLFFKFRATDVAIEHQATKASVNTALLGGIHDDLARKLARLSSAYVGQLEI